jgi:hypothetical protein
MSSNRLRYDTCAYEQAIKQSTSPLSYTLDTTKFDNCSKCRMQLGLVGGNNVSQIAGNLVDLENDLRGQTRKNSDCPSKQYQSACPLNAGGPCNVNSIPYGNDCKRRINTQPVHLQPCQMIRYKPVALPPPMNIQKCNMPQPSCNQNGPKPFNI